MTGLCQAQTTGLCQNVSCPAGQTCNAATGQCQVLNQCATVTCPTGQQCNATTGLCEVLDLCASVTCPTGEECDPATGDCEPVDLCAVVTCPAGQVCDPASGACEPINLCAAITCAPGQLCDPATGTCVMPLSVVFVDDDAAPGGDGESWASAFDDLQVGIAEAVDLGGSVEVWVAEGTYYATDDGDRTISFQLRNNVALLGGFAGNETDADQRDPQAHPTVLSGDIQQDDRPPLSNSANNSCHVVAANGVADTAILDGFVIRDGVATSPLNYDPCGTGGGLIVLNAAPRITNNVFENNKAYQGGAIGIDLLGGSGNETAPHIEWCTFSENIARFGGAIHAWSDEHSVANCRFELNSASNTVTGIVNLPSGGATFKVNVRDSVFVKNSSDDTGGAMHDGSAVNCVFVENNAAVYGGAVMRYSTSDEIVNCSFFQNRAGALGGAIYYSGTIAFTLANCIFWGNADSAGIGESGQMYFIYQNTIPTHCCIQGLSTIQGTGNISLNPQFTNPLGADGILGTEDDDFTLQSTSPCRNTGNVLSLPTDELDIDEDGDVTERWPTDFNGNPRFQGANVDMGAYELP